MTPQERELLSQFLNDLLNTPAGLKDAEAAAMIDNALRSRPDAAYVLVQHAILSDQALHQAQSDIATLRNQLQNAGQQAGASFLGGGAPSQGPWGPRPTAQPQQGYAQPGYGQQGYAPAVPGGLFGGGGGLGSFLRTAGTTAAGVVAGDMLFSGLSGLFGGHGGGFGGGFGGGYGGGNENIVINNYNDDSSDGDSGFDDSSGGDDSSY